MLRLYDLAELSLPEKFKSLVSIPRQIQRVTWLKSSAVRHCLIHVSIRGSGFVFPVALISSDFLAFVCRYFIENGERMAHNSKAKRNV